MTPTREEFMFFSLPEKLLFYFLILCSVGYMCFQLVEPFRQWMKGHPSETTKGDRSRWQSWTSNLLIYVLAQKKVRNARRKSGAPMHLAIFYGFLTLLIATTLLGINTYSPVKFHRGLYYLIYEQVTDWMGFVFLIGVTWALIRRVWLGCLAAPPIREVPTSFGGEQELQKQGENHRRQPLTSSPSDYWTLALLAALGLSGFWVEATRISVAPKPWDWTDPIGIRWAHFQGDWSSLPNRAAVYLSVWWLHSVLVGVFFCVLPKLRLRHVLLAIASVAGKSDRPMGKLRLVTLEEVEAAEKVGAKVAPDYSRWQLLTLDACMECGRCTEVCPAWNVGKILNPKQVVQDLRAALRSGEEIAEKVSHEALWACTTCNACVEACPVQVPHVDLIVEARRNLVSEARFSGSGATMLRQAAATSSPWGAPANTREDWMRGLDIPLCRDKPEFEWLFWVGCAGATDPGGIKTTRAVAQLLKTAGIDFACLGSEESCSGDPARRVGEEFLFQDLAARNVSVMKRYNVKKVVTACPHCFNSLRHEYKDMEGDFEVLHHSQLLSDLVTKGTLKGGHEVSGSVTFHDPCYLSRINGDSESARKVIGGKLAEPVHHGMKTLCCGAGGGRMWMEEESNQRPGNRRSQELIATGASTVAVACPFCKIMLGDSLRQVPKGDSIKLVDIAELMVAANAGSQE